MLTVGMAHFDDFHGAYFAIQSLRLYHDTSDVEIVVVDNNPGSRHSEPLQGVLKSCGGKYVEYNDRVGTSASRDQIFEHASGEYVLVVDSHVLLVPGALAALGNYYRENPETSNLISGPLLYDPLGDCIATHFDDQWRDEMWGTWGRAWQCSCGGTMFSVSKYGDNLQTHKLKMGMPLLKSCDDCGRAIPQTGWAGHESVLRNAGYIDLGQGQEPFEIPGMGLGLFSCRRDAWPGFNGHALGFGGEELYIHEKFRQRGARAVCLPQLKWVHRFCKPEGVSYPLTLFNKIRNYVLEFRELGYGLGPVKRHFVDEGRMGLAEWQGLIADPVGYRGLV